MKLKSGEGTLLASVLMSSPGPIVVGAALFWGRSTTQLADFIRRTAELVAIIVSWVVFRILNKDSDREVRDKDRLEDIVNLCVGATMCLSGVVMLVIGLFSLNGEKGNVLPGFIIAILGVITNSWFCLRYRRLNHEKPDAILAAQSKLYLAKSVVDICIAIPLAFLLIAPKLPLAQYVDLCGSVIVALYLMAKGAMTIRSSNDRKETDYEP